MWTSPAVPDALPLVCVNGGLLYDHEILWPALAPLAAHRWRESLRALSVPSLVIHGERDLVPPEQSRRTVQLLPHARLELVADAGHLPFWEALERFFRLVNGSLGTTTHAPAPPRPPLVSSPG